MSEREVSIGVLAAGWGTRAELPHSKILVKVSDEKTILYHMISDFEEHNIHSVNIITNNTHYGGIENEIREIKPKIDIILHNNGISSHDNTQGALGDMLMLIEKTGVEGKAGIVILPCDTPYWKEFSIKDFLDFIEKSDYECCTIAADMSQINKKKGENVIKNRFGCIELDDDGKTLKSFEEKPDVPKSELRAVPFYFLTQNEIKLLKEYIMEGKDPGSPGNLIHYLKEMGVKINVMVVGDKIIDAGVREDIKEAGSY